MRLISNISLFIAMTVLMSFAAHSSFAETAASANPQPLTVWADPQSGQLFLLPGKGRIAVPISGAKADLTELQTAVEKELSRQRRSGTTASATAAEPGTTHAAQNRGTGAPNSVTVTAAAQSASTQTGPTLREILTDWRTKFSVHTLIYGDYGLYTHTGFGPGFLTEQQHPGPGNNLFNSFDLTRAYLDFFFRPNDALLMRVTPELYRAIGNAQAVSGGATSAFGSNLNGNLSLRLKYAYLRYNKLFRNIAPLSSNYVSLGLSQNPLIAWEDDLFGFRYVTSTPWGFAGLTPAMLGAKVGGPVTLNEFQFADYEIGVFNNANFRDFEQTNTKQVAGRLSVYPLGALWRFDGLGFTGYYDYGYGNAAPDIANMPALYAGPKSHIMHGAALMHYTAATWSLIGEFDFGHNSFTPLNLFSASAPSDLFGLGPTKYADFTQLTNALLNNGRSMQEGFSFMGRYRIPHTPITLFGLFQQFMPNMKVALDPLDFQRFVIGASYEYSEALRFAIDSQNISYYHDQFNFPTAYARTFGVLPGVTGPSIIDAVPRDTHAFFLNVEFKY